MCHLKVNTMTVSGQGKGSLRVVVSGAEIVEWVTVSREPYELRSNFSSTVCDFADNSVPTSARQVSNIFLPSRLNQHGGGEGDFSIAASRIGTDELRKMEKIRN